jgi:DNA-binding LacI/PurR family transcriptional regulator
MASVRQIAKEAGVSITTVSRVLNNHPQVSAEVRERVLAMANESRYIGKVGRRSTTNVAFIYTDDMTLGSPFDTALMQGMSAGLDRAGLDLLVLNAQRSRRSHETFSQLFMRKGVRGAIVRTTTHTRHLCREVAAEGFPAVVVADEFDEPWINTVDADSYTASHSAMTHLINLGHKRIACALHVVDDHDHARRLEAYRDALIEAGLEIDERLIMRVPAYRRTGAAALRQMMAMPERPTAAYVTDPLAAVGVLQEALCQGVRVPDDFSVIGFDDGDARFGTFPQMSAVCQDTEALGRAAMERLTGLIDQNDQPATVPTDCWLELHESTGPAPSTANSNRPIR